MYNLPLIDPASTSGEAIADKFMMQIEIMFKQILKRLKRSIKKNAERK